MQLPFWCRRTPTGCRSMAARCSAFALVVMVGTVAAACGASVPGKVSAAQRYATKANLTLLDLPAGWKSQSSSTSSPSGVSALSPAQAKQAHALVATLPADCQALSETFVASLQNAAPPGSLTQSQQQFVSASDGGATISSTVVVFGTLARSQATFGLYAAPSFPGCLQAFLRQVLIKVYDLTVHQVTAASIAVPAPTPAGVQATAVAVTQSATASGSQTNVSTSNEVILESGRAMAFVEEESESTAIPVDTQTNFVKSVSIVANRLVPPPP